MVTIARGENARKNREAFVRKRGAAAPINPRDAEANAVIAAMTERVCAARTIRERANALALLRRAVQGDESRLDQEDRAAVITVADEELDFLRGRKLGQAALRAQLAVAIVAAAVAMGDVSDERFASFKPTAEDLLVLERKIRHGAKGRWLAAFLAHRTGAWDQHILEPLIAEKRAESLKNALGHTPAVRAMSKRRAVRKSSSP